MLDVAHVICFVMLVSLLSKVAELRPDALHSLFFRCVTIRMGHAVAQLVEVLRYKPEGRRFDGVIRIFR